MVTRKAPYPPGATGPGPVMGPGSATAGSDDAWNDKGSIFPPVLIPVSRSSPLSQHGRSLVLWSRMMTFCLPAVGPASPVLATNWRAAHAGGFPGSAVAVGDDEADGVAGGAEIGGVARCAGRSHQPPIRTINTTAAVASEIARPPN